MITARTNQRQCHREGGRVLNDTDELGNVRYITCYLFIAMSRNNSNEITIPALD